MQKYYGGGDQELDEFHGKVMNNVPDIWPRMDVYNYKVVAICGGETEEEDSGKNCPKRVDEY